MTIPIWLALIVLGVILVMIGNAIGRAGGGTEASFVGCLPGIPGLLCIAVGVVWGIVVGIIALIPWIHSL